MDQSADPWGVAPACVIEDSRNAIARFTAVMTLITLVLASTAMRIGTTYVDEQKAVALVAESAEQSERLGLLSDGGPAADASTWPSPPPSTSTSTTTPPGPATAPAIAAPATNPTPTDEPSGPLTEASPPSGIAEDPAGGQTPTTLAADPSPAPPAGSSPSERGARAMAAIDYPWRERLTGWRIDFLDGRDGLLGLTMVDEKRIEIYVRTDQSEELLLHILAHELGHAVDVTLNDGSDRRRWQAARDIGSEPWWPDSAASDFRTGAGDFAESFAYWQVRSSSYRSKLGPPPDAAQIELLAELARG